MTRQKLCTKFNTTRNALKAANLHLWQTLYLFSREYHVSE